MTPGTRVAQKPERRTLGPLAHALYRRERVPDCIFCVPTEAESLKDNLILRVTPYSRVMLNKYPYNNGHLMVASHRHTADLAELPDQEFSDLMFEVRNAVEVLKAALHPQGVNVGLNLGGVPGPGSPTIFTGTWCRGGPEIRILCRWLRPSTSCRSTYPRVMTDSAPISLSSSVVGRSSN